MMRWGWMDVVLLLAVLVSCVPLALAPDQTETPAAAPIVPTSIPLLAPGIAVTAPSTPATQGIQIYFTDRERLAQGQLPFEMAVTRQMPVGADPARFVLEEFFKGPTPEEQARGLEQVTSGFSGFSEVRVQDEIAHVFLSGECRSNGATYTIAQPLMISLSQLEGIRYVKFYDSSGDTEDPQGESNSIPFCLEP